MEAHLLSGTEVVDMSLDSVFLARTEGLGFGLGAGLGVALTTRGGSFLASVVLGLGEGPLLEGGGTSCDLGLSESSLGRGLVAGLLLPPAAELSASLISEAVLYIELRAANTCMHIMCTYTS